MNKTSNMKGGNVKKIGRKKDEWKLLWGIEEMKYGLPMREQASRDHVEGMDDMGLGMAGETIQQGGEELENICSVYLLRSRKHHHNPLTRPMAFLWVLLSLCPPSFPSHLIYFLLFPFLFFSPFSVISQHAVMWPSGKSLNLSVLSSGCIRLLYIAVPYVMFNKIYFYIRLFTRLLQAQVRIL